VAGTSGDYIAYLLEKPLAEEPGSTWRYNSGYPNILGYIIEQRSGMTLVEFADAHLFAPLGIHRFFWQAIEKESRPSCAGGLRLTSRDLARIGRLYLDDGVWQGKRILPEVWVEDSTREHLKTDWDDGYGYLWKRTSSLDGAHEIFFASGTGGQYLACIPDLDVVAVTTAVSTTDKSKEVAMLLLEHVIPAL
jgi:CubicO group peptidase (beta-lactamase class C family)